MKDPKFIFICCHCATLQDAAVTPQCGCGAPMQPMIDAATRLPIVATTAKGREILAATPAAA